MAGRPRIYANAAEKTRAYREREAHRYTKTDRITHEQFEADLRRLREAVHAAQDRGDPLARSLRTVMMMDMLSDLAAYFETGELNQQTPKTAISMRKKAPK